MEGKSSYFLAEYMAILNKGYNDSLPSSYMWAVTKFWPSETFMEIVSYI